MIHMSPAVRRLCVAAALFIGTTGVANAMQQQAWWCYNGTCCSYVNGAVTQPCMFNCDTGNGEKLVVSCSGA